MAVTDPNPVAETEVVPAPEVATNPVPIPNPTQVYGQRLKKFAIAIYSPIDRLIDSAAGYDEKILYQYGSPTDEKRRRNIGRAILVATAVGSLGWFSKILISFPGMMALPIAATMAFLYAVLSYSLESFFAANVDPFASLKSKIFSLVGRLLLSALIAFAGALPWVTMSLRATVQLEMSKMALQEQAALRDGLSATYGQSAIEAKASAFQKEALGWTNAAVTLPMTVQTSIAQAQACSASEVALKESSEKKTAAYNARLAALARIESAQNVTPASLRSVSAERAQTRSAIDRLAKELQAKGEECRNLTQAAQGARQSHLNFVSDEQLASQKRLALLRKDEGEVDAKLRVERARVDQLIKETSEANSSAEFSALMRVIQTQLFAQVLAAMIFIGLLLVDVLPLTLRLFSRPGPYDAEKRVDDLIKGMRADGRLLEAQLMRDARRKEMESEELKALVQAQCRPHIMDLTLNGVSTFLRKQART